MKISEFHPNNGLQLEWDVVRSPKFWATFADVFVDAPRDKVKPGAIAINAQKREQIKDLALMAPTEQNVARWAQGEKSMLDQIKHELAPEEAHGKLDRVITLASPNEQDDDEHDGPHELLNLKP